IGLGVADPLRDPLVALAEQEQRALTGALRAEALEEFGGALPLHPELARRDRRSALRSTGGGALDLQTEWRHQDLGVLGGVHEQLPGGGRGLLGVRLERSIRAGHGRGNGVLLV